MKDIEQSVYFHLEDKQEFDKRDNQWRSQGVFDVNAYSRSGPRVLNTKDTYYFMGDDLWGQSGGQLGRKPVFLSRC